MIYAVTKVGFCGRALAAVLLLSASGCLSEQQEGEEESSLEVALDNLSSTGILEPETDGRYHLRAADSWKKLPASLGGRIVVVDKSQDISGSFDGRSAQYVPGDAISVENKNLEGEPKAAMFNLKGATVSNMHVYAWSGTRYADSFYVKKGGTNTLRSVVWDRVGEDALSVKDTAGATVTIDGGSASGYTDKLFQINVACTFVVKGNFTATPTAISGKVNKALRTNGGNKSMRVNVTFAPGVTIEGGSYGIYTDSKNATIVATGANFNRMKKAAIVAPVGASVTKDAEDTLQRP